MNLSPLKQLLADNPIVVTGMGAFSAAGTDVVALWQAAAKGHSSGRQLTFTQGEQIEIFPVCAAPATDPKDPRLHPVRKADRGVQMALRAAQEAVNQAGGLAEITPERVGVAIGSSRGPIGKIYESLSGQHRGPLPTLAASSTFATVSGSLSQAFQFKGPGMAVSATCASSAFAISFAAEQILLGQADVMLVGGTEAPLHLSILNQLAATGVLAKHSDARQACRPFDIARSGLILGEGSGILILESAAHAAARGAKPLARLTGWATGLDTSGRTAVQDNGNELTRVMRQALALADLNPTDIAYINAHGTGTQMNDAAEAVAVRNLFGIHADNIFCTATKPVTGHCLGATSALEAIITIEALRHQLAPPTANCIHLDPACPIRPMPVGEPTIQGRHALSNSLGFWGYHGSLVLSLP